MTRTCDRILVIALLGVVVGPLVAQENLPTLQVPFAEGFHQGRLDPAWKVDLSPGNTIEVKDGTLEIRARMNTYAHIERGFGIDFVRASCAIKPAPAITWCTSLFVYWNPGNWCQLGVISRDGGTYYALEMIDQQAHEYSFAKCAFDTWCHVGIELGSDCIRYLSSATGKDFTVEEVHPRPEQFAGVPRLLIVGKGHGGPAAYPAPDLDNDYTSADAMGTSYVKEIAVTPLEWGRLRATAEERSAWDAKGRDGPGEKELAADDDPSFESVSRYFPAMKLPREVVGVKDHPHDIGIAPDATLQLNDGCTDPKLPTAFFELGEPPYRFGSGKLPCQKRLLNGYMPVVMAADRHDGLDIEQTVFGYTKGLSPDEPLAGYVRVKLANTTDQARKVALRLRVEPASDKRPPKDWRLDVPAQGQRTLEVKVPFTILEDPAEDVTAADFDQKLKEVSDDWARLIGQGTRFEIPEPRVQDAYRAWLAYNFLNVDKRGGVYHICDGAGFYEQVYGYSAALYCLVLDLMGYPELASTYIDSLLTFQRPDGLFYVNFGHTDTGTLLHVMSEHYRLTRDTQWLGRVAPKMIAMCNWIIEHRKESMFGIHGKRAVVHGLIRFRPYCDHELPAFDYYSNAYLCKGMQETAAVLAEVGMADEAARLSKEAQAYLHDLHVSMDAAVITHDGMKMLPIMPDTHTLLKETNYTANGYYGLLASCLLETGIPAYDDPRSDLLVNMLRRKGGLVAGMCQFFDMIDHAYTYGYWMTCLKRDEVKRVILGLYGSMAYGMTRDTYSAVECTRIRSGENYWTLPHTYSNTKQLRLLRQMLVREEGNDLLIGYAIPRPWLAAGKRVAVTKAPTAFGETSFAIESNADAGILHVHVDPPARGMNGVVKVRLRHPARLDIKEVTGSPQVPTTVKGDVIELPTLTRPIDLTVRY